MPIRPKSGLTREELREVIYTAVPALTREQAKKVLDELLEEIISALVADDDVNIRGCGKFKVQHKSSRIGRNPITLQSAIISSRRVIKFAPSKKTIMLMNMKPRRHPKKHASDDVQDLTKRLI